MLIRANQAPHLIVTPERGIRQQRKIRNKKKSTARDRERREVLRLTSQSTYEG